MAITMYVHFCRIVGRHSNTIVHFVIKASYYVYTDKEVVKISGYWAIANSSSGRCGSQYYDDVIMMSLCNSY